MLRTAQHIRTNQANIMLSGELEFSGSQLAACAHIMTTVGGARVEMVVVQHWPKQRCDGWDSKSYGQRCV